MTWYTFFDARHESFSGVISFLLPLCLVIGLAILSADRALFHSHGMDPKTDPALYLIRGFVCLYFLVVAILVPAWALQNHRAKMALDSGRYEITVGTVSQFSVTYKYGKEHSESFLVGSVPFTIPADCNMTCYSTLRQYGGPIRDGLQIRISHVGNAILKLEIARD